MSKSPEQLALQRAVDAAGSQTELAIRLAKATGKPIRQGHVWKWLQSTNGVSAEMAIPVEQSVGGTVTRYELRPTVFGDAPSKEAAA